MSGWVCSYRKIWEHPIFAGNAERVGVWDWMVKTAARETCSFQNAGKTIVLERGQLCVSQRQICQETGISHRRLRTFLKDLESDTAITQQTTQGRTLITICNYSKYQDIKKQATQQATQERHTNKQITNIPVGTGDKIAVDSASVIFRNGVEILTRSGLPDRQARSLLGRLRKSYGDAALIEALGRCEREAAIDPVAFLNGALKFQQRTAQPEIGERRISKNGRVLEFEGAGAGWVEVHE